MAEMMLPAAVLIVWSIVMTVWLAVSRLPALNKAGIDLKVAKPGGRGSDLEAVLPPEVMWKSHNFTHLMEQPTIFYPSVVIIALLGPGEIDVMLAWGYVVIRIAHSLWQALVNTIPVRFTLFVLGTICLATLAVRAVMAALGGGDAA